MFNYNFTNTNCFYESNVYSCPFLTRIKSKR